MVWWIYLQSRAINRVGIQDVRLGKMRALRSATVAPRGSAAYGQLLGKLC